MGSLLSVALCVSLSRQNQDLKKILDQFRCNQRVEVAIGSLLSGALCVNLSQQTKSTYFLNKNSGPISMQSEGGIGKEKKGRKSSWIWEHAPSVIYPTTFPHSLQAIRKKNALFLHKTMKIF